MTDNVKSLLEKVKTSNDINTWVLSLLSLELGELEAIVKGSDGDAKINKKLPVSVYIVAKFLLSEKEKDINKVKFIGDCIKGNKEMNITENTTKLKLEFINSATMQK